LTPEQVNVLDQDLKNLLDTAPKGDIPTEEPIVLPDEVAAADAIRRQQEQLESAKKEIPSFREGMEITGMRIGMTAFGTGLIEVVGFGWTKFDEN
jgi:hypothetical protein